MLEKTIHFKNVLEKIRALKKVLSIVFRSTFVKKPFFKTSLLCKKNAFYKVSQKSTF